MNLTFEQREDLINAGVEAREAIAALPLHERRVLGIGDGARRQPRGLLVRCPAHADRTPSCSVRVASDGTLSAEMRVQLGRLDASDPRVAAMVAEVERLESEVHP